MLIYYKNREVDKQINQCKKIQFVKVILNTNIGCWYYYQINNNNLNNFKFFAFIDPFIWPNQYRFLFSQKYMLYIYLIIFKDNCINSNNFSAIDLIIYYRSIIDLKIEFKIQILYIISSLVVSVQSSMNISSIPHVDRMSNIYNNSMVRFYHHVIHDLAGMGNNSPIFFFFFLSKLYIYILILWFFFFFDLRSSNERLVPHTITRTWNHHLNRLFVLYPIMGP